MEKFTLINKARSRIKVFEPFEDTSKTFSVIDAILISYDCIFRRSSKRIMNGSRVKSIEKARNEKKNYGRKVGEKTYTFNSFKKNGE